MHSQNFNQSFLILGLFENLSKLELANCDLTQLPQSIGKLKKLNILELGGNQLKVFPKSITECPRLHFIFLYGNQFSYSSTIEIAQEFLSKENTLAAIHMLSKAIEMGGDENAWLHSPYIEVVQLLKAMTGKLFLKDDESLSYFMIEAVKKAGVKHEKLDLLFEILTATEEPLKSCIPDDMRHNQFMKFRNKLIHECMTIIHSFSHSNRNIAICNLLEILFSINETSTAISATQEEIQLIHSQPDYNFLAEITDSKSYQLDRISNILECASEKIAKEKKFGLAQQVAEMIPVKEKRTHALGCVEYFKFHPEEIVNPVAVLQKITISEKVVTNSQPTQFTVNAVTSKTFSILEGFKKFAGEEVLKLINGIPENELLQLKQAVDLLNITPSHLDSFERLVSLLQKNELNTFLLHDSLLYGWNRFILLYISWEKFMSLPQSHSLNSDFCVELMNDVGEFYIPSEEEEWEHLEYVEFVVQSYINYYASDISKTESSKDFRKKLRAQLISLSSGEKA